MKVKLLLLAFALSIQVISNFQCYGQADSILNEMTNSCYSKPELIKEGSNQILKFLSLQDIKGATQIRDYLLAKVEDSIFVAFDYSNYPLLLYWMKDYDELIRYFSSFDSLVLANAHKIRPNDSELYLIISWDIPAVAKNMFDAINKSNISRENKEVLILDLHKRAMEIDGGPYELRNYNKRVKQFERRFPQSRLKEYVKNHILQGNSWDYR